MLSGSRYADNMFSLRPSCNACHNKNKRSEGRYHATEMRTHASFVQLELFEKGPDSMLFEGLDGH